MRNIGKHALIIKICGKARNGINKFENSVESKDE